MPPVEPREATVASKARRAQLALAVLAVLVAGGVFGFVAAQRPGPEALWGDEGTYIAMAASLARDGDLRFEQPDEVWALQRVPDRGATVILQRTGNGVTYSKPPLYPLLAAPLFGLLGETSLVAINVLALAVGLFCAWLYLRRIGDLAGAWLTLASFTVAGVVIPYLAWRMSESLQVGLMLAGTVLVCGALRPPPEGVHSGWQRLLDHSTAPFAGGFLLGLLVSMRLSNAALAGGALLALLVTRRWRSLLLAAAGCVAGLALLLVLSQVMLGTASPYTAERTSFNADLGYPLNDGDAGDRFDARPATHRFGLRATRATLYSAFYFVIGRHTGLLAYFPLALVLLGIIVRSRDRVSLAVATGVLTLAVFYLLYTPNNFFGGSTFLGNRYFLVAYPALLIALPKLPSTRSIAAVLAVALAFGGSAMASSRKARALASTSQTHAAAGVFRWLPYESTAIGIQGHEDRFWSMDYVRFVDPWAQVEPDQFVLHAERPDAEMMIASHRPRERIYFLARSHGGAAGLAWADWRTGGSIDLATAPGTPPVELTIAPSAPWRRHAFWFGRQATYEARTLRLGAVGPPGSTIELFYLGGGERLEQGFQRQLLSAQVPQVVAAGGTDAVNVRVRNDDRIAWERRDVLPVTIGYRLMAVDGLAGQGWQLLPADVQPGEEVDLEVEISWPAEPGEYRLIVDLRLHPVRWFADVVGEPLLERTVRVE